MVNRLDNDKKLELANLPDRTRILLTKKNKYALYKKYPVLGIVKHSIIFVY